MRWRCGSAWVVMGVVAVAAVACGGAAPRGVCPGTSERPAATLPPVDGSGGGALRWRVTLGTCTSADPASALAVDEGVAYVVMGDALRAIDVESGRQRWRASLPPAASGERRQWEVDQVGGAVMAIAKGIRSVATGVQRRLTLSAFDAGTGRPRYQRELQGWRDDVESARFLSPGYGFTGTAGAVTIDDPRVSLLDPDTGTPRWTATLPPLTGKSWGLTSDGGVAYARAAQPVRSDLVQRIDLATGQVLPPLVLAGGDTDADLRAVVGELLLFEGPEGAFAVRASDGSAAWRIPATGAPQDHLSKWDTVLGEIDPLSRLSVSARRDGGGFGVYDLDSGAWIGRWKGDWKHDTPLRAQRGERLTVVHTDGTAWFAARDASGKASWRSPTLPDWDLGDDDGALTGSGGVVTSFVCTRLPGHGCASYDLVGVQL